MTEPATFSTDTSGLEECRRPEVVELSDGDTLDLRIADRLAHAWRDYKVVSEDCAIQVESE